MRHALIDIDWLGQLYPVQNPDDPYSLDLAFTNLQAIAPNFLAAGARYFVIAATLTSHEELDQLRRAVPEVDLTICRVDVPPQVAVQRIERRELGGLKEDFLARTDALAEQIKDAVTEDVVVVNDGRPITEVAADLFGQLRWS
jgi:thymidylate kinase